MAKRRPVYLNRNQNFFSKILIVSVILFLAMVIGIKSIELHKKLQDNIQRYAELEAAYSEELEKKSSLEEYARYVKTDAYVEEMAKDRYGLVHEGEIIFKEKE